MDKELNKERAELIEQLNQCKNLKQDLINREDAIKNRIRKNTDALMEKYKELFLPGTVWVYYKPNRELEFFKIDNCEADYYAYRDENIEDCSVAFRGEYISIPNIGMDDLNNEILYNKKDIITFTVKELRNLQPVSEDKWNDVIEMIERLQACLRNCVKYE